MENKDENIKQIDVVAIVKAMWQHRKLYFITLPIVIVISCLLILCVPRYYNSTAKLAPELSSFNSSSLGALAITLVVKNNEYSKVLVRRKGYDNECKQ